MTTGGRQYTSPGEENVLSRAELARIAAEMVDESRLQTSVETLTGFGPRHSAASPEGHSHAAEWIESELRSFGYAVESSTFEIPGQDPPRNGLNISGIRGPLDRPVPLVGAHYDTVVGSPGADDNASGVAAMLECARVIASLPRPVPLLVAAFDAEENQPPADGLHGSSAFVSSFNDDSSRIAGAYILEMVGFSAPKGNQRVPKGLQLLFPRAFDMLRESEFAGESLVAITNARSRWMGRKLEAAAAAHSNGLNILPMELPGWMRTPRNLRRSDHFPFWEAGIPAVMIGDTANFRNPNYHKPMDTADTLDFSLMTKITRGLAASIAVTVG